MREANILARFPVLWQKALQRQGRSNRSAGDDISGSYCAVGGRLGGWPMDGLVFVLTWTLLSLPFGILVGRMIAEMNA